MIHLVARGSRERVSRAVEMDMNDMGDDDIFTERGCSIITAAGTR